MVTPVGFLFIGVAVGVTGGLVWGVVRERGKIRNISFGDLN